MVKKYVDCTFTTATIPGPLLISFFIRAWKDIVERDSLIVKGRRMGKVDESWESDIIGRSLMYR
jgi:hypothetical protein